MIAANAADIGNIVRRRRTKAGLSQADLARTIGVSRKWIADLEKCHPRAQLQLVLDVLNALDALVDVVDAPGEETATVTRARATPSPAGGDHKSLGVSTTIAAWVGAMDQPPTVTMPRELSQSLERATTSMQLSPELKRTIDSFSQLNAINPEQLASIRSALYQAPMDEGTLRAIRGASKALTRAEADRSDAMHRLGSRDDIGDTPHG